MPTRQPHFSATRRQLRFFMPRPENKTGVAFTARAERSSAPSRFNYARVTSPCAKPMRLRLGKCAPSSCATSPANEQMPRSQTCRLPTGPITVTLIHDARMPLPACTISRPDACGAGFLMIDFYFPAFQRFLRAIYAMHTIARRRQQYRRRAGDSQKEA